MLDLSVAVSQLLTDGILYEEVELTHLCHPHSPGDAGIQFRWILQRCDKSGQGPEPV